MEKVSTRFERPSCVYTNLEGRFRLIQKKIRLSLVSLSVYSGRRFLLTYVCVYVVCRLIYIFVSLIANASSRARASTGERRGLLMEQEISKLE